MLARLLLPCVLLAAVVVGAAEKLPPHPRLIAQEPDWARLQTKLARDPALAALHAELLQQAREQAALPPVTRKMVGRRLLHTSRELLQRVLLFSYAARTLEGATATEFAARAEQEMLAAARFEDWNPSHFLDVGEATAALALGYDWLHDRLSPAARQEIAIAILEKGIRPGLDPKDRRNSWQRAEHNWNQVCFGGLTLGALALAEFAPQESAQLLALARRGITHGLKPYVPDGVYPEGPSYWAYGTTYQVLMIAGLESALGTDWEITRSPGLLASAAAYVQTTAPSGKAFNFSDGGEAMGFEPALFWFAQRVRDPGLLQAELSRIATPAGRAKTIAGNRFAVFAALWWPESAAEPNLPLDWHGDGRNPIVVFRESWTTPDSLYLGIKAGAASLNHGHMDAGSFVFEADGVRWAIDLGMQNYESLESKQIKLWDMTQDSQRWTVYRLNNRAHNTLTLDDALHQVNGRATVSSFVSAPGRRHAVLDLSPVFAGRASRVTRGFALQANRSVIVQDELDGLRPAGLVRWQLVTRAAIELRGPTATLRQDGRNLTLRVLAPAGATWAQAPAAPPPDHYNAPNPGVSVLSLTVPAPASGQLTLAVQLTPGSGDSAPAAIRPLSQW